MANTIQFKRGTSAPGGSTAAVIAQPLLHYNTDGSVANLYVGHDTDNGDNIRIGAIVDPGTSLGSSDDKIPTQLAVKTYVDAQVATENTIDEMNDTDISSVASGNILVYDGSNSWDNKAMSGDATLASTGALTIAAGAVENSMLADDAVDSDELAAGSVDLAHLAATGTASTSTYLRGDYSWQALTSAAIATYSNATNNRIITSVDSSSVNSEANLTFDGSALTLTGTMYITEQADAAGDVAGKGQLWVNTATPNELYFTDDAGTDHRIEANTDTNTQLSTEQVQDIVGGMFTGNTETRIAATYEDGDGTIDLVVTDMTANDNDDVSVANLKTALASDLGGAATIGDANDTITFGEDVVVTGDLTVSGTTTTVNSTVVSIADPLFELGASGSDDNLDRGIVMKYNSSGAKKAFMGFDDSTGKFTMIPDATDSSAVMSGTAGTLVMTTFEGALSGNASTASSAATLTTARNIGGVSFDGSAAINLPGVNAAGNQNTTGSAATLTTPRAINGTNFDGSAAITITAAGSTLSDTVTVGKGGTGATTLTDGGVLLGSGTGAVTAMAVLADGEMIVGDGTTDPVAESGATLRTSIGCGATAGNTSLVTVGTIATGTWAATDVAVAHGGTGASTAAAAATNLGLGTGDSPQLTAINLGHASDTTIARSSAGVVTIEGVTVITANGTIDGGTY